MNKETISKLVKSLHGRIILHLAASQIDSKFTWHLKGILRELFPYIHKHNSKILHNAKPF